MSDRAQFDPSAGAPSDRPRGELIPTRSRTTYPLENADADGLTAENEGIRLDSVRLREYLRILHRRRWLALTSFTLVMAVSVVHTFSKVEIPEYEARVRLLVEPERRVPGSRTLDAEALALIDLQTQHAIVNSHSFARKTMQALGIWEPQNYAAAHPAQPRSTGGIGNLVTAAFDKVKGFFGTAVSSTPGAETPEPTTLTDTPEAQAARIQAFLSGVRVVPVPRTRIVEIAYVSTDPIKAADYANAIGRQYIDQNLEFKFLETKEASDWLRDRLVEQRKRVEEAEEAVRAYRQRYQVVISTDERAKASVERLSELNTAVTRARTERIEKEAALNRVRAVQGDRAALEALPEIASNATVQDLRTQLAAATRQHAQLAEKLLDRHPDLQNAQKAVDTTRARLDAAIENVAKVIRSDYETARSAEESLTRVYEQQRREATQSNQTDIDFAVLQRDAESNRQIYEAMLQQARESEVAGQPTTNNIRVLDPASIPRVPAPTSRIRDLQVGALAAFAISLVLVWFTEYIDNRVTSPADVQRYLRLPYLGMIPTLRNDVIPKGGPLVSNSVPFQFVESLRGIRTNVLFGTASDGLRSLVVTSANPGDGKTIASCNLAISMAQTGQRVLLIDGDLRRPRVHAVFGVAQEPGLTNLIVGKAPAVDAIRRTPIPGVALAIMPAGRIPPNPAELLGSKRFADFLSQLEPHFDWVIIDSPPAVAVTDPAVLANKATATILVVSAEKTSRYAAREALNRLDAAGARVLGVILNYVSLDDNPYYYARQYRSYYAEYEKSAKAQAS